MLVNRYLLSYHIGYFSSLIDAVVGCWLSWIVAFVPRFFPLHLCWISWLRCKSDWRVRGWARGRWQLVLASPNTWTTSSCPSKFPWWWVAGKPPFYRLRLEKCDLRFTELVISVCGLPPNLASISVIAPTHRANSLPVWAQAIISRPSLRIGMAYLWMGVGFTYPARFTFSRVWSYKPA